MAYSLDLSALAPSEKLFLWRYRQEAEGEPGNGRRRQGISQSEAAAKLNISVTAYQRLEQGGRARLSAEDYAALSTVLTSVTTPPLLSEQCLLARRRANMRLEDLSAALRLTVPRVIELERTADIRVLDYWRGRGFSFALRRRRSRRCSVVRGHSAAVAVA